MKKYFIFIFIIFLGCKNIESKKEVEFDKKNSILIEREKALEYINFKDFINNISILQLKNIDDVDIINSIDKIKFYNNNYFVLDRKKSNLFVFDEDGNLKNKIGVKGNGPGEVNSIVDFDIDKKNNEIIVVDNKLNSFFRYKNNGEFVSSKKITSFFPSHIAINNEKIISSCDYASDNFKDLLFLNLNYEVENVYFQFPKDIIPYGFDYTGGLNNNSKEVLYQEPLSSLIYGIDDMSNIYLKYKIDLGETSWLEENKYNHEAFSQANRKSIGNNSLSYLTNKYLENDDFMIFQYINYKIFTGIYNKKTKNLHTNETTFKEDYLISLFFLSPNGLYDDYSFLKGITIENYKVLDKEVLKRLEDIAPEVSSLLEKHKSNENAYILKYDLKK